MGRMIEPPWVHGPEDPPETCEDCRHEDCMRVRGDWECDWCDELQKDSAPVYKNGDDQVCEICWDSWDKQ